MPEVILNEKNFKAEVLDVPGPVLVDFWAEWCGPCRMMGTVIEQLAKDFEGKAKVCKINVDENPGPAGNYNIMAIPTICIFKAGQVVERFVGVQSKESITSKLNSHL
ncbi:MAG: thioredoxin [Elusimicrobiota bacterium]